MVKQKGRKGKTTKNYYHNEHNTNEIPHLLISNTEFYGDFEKKTVVLECSAWSMEECIGGLDYILNEYKKLNKPKKERDIS